MDCSSLCIWRGNESILFCFCVCVCACVCVCSIITKAGHVRMLIVHFVGAVTTLERVFLAIHVAKQPSLSRLTHAHKTPELRCKLRTPTLLVMLCCWFFFCCCCFFVQKSKKYIESCKMQNTVLKVPQQRISSLFFFSKYDVRICGLTCVNFFRWCCNSVCASVSSLRV